MSGTGRLRCAAALASAAIVCGRPASAQVIDSYFVPVPRAVGGAGTGDRSRSEAASAYEALGVRLGTFTLRPDLSEGIGYNSNVEGRAGGRGSPVLRTAGSVTATSGWSRNSAFLQVTMDDQRYLDLPQQSYTDWSASVTGTVDVGHNAIVASYSHLNVNQTPGSIDPVTFIGPVPLRIDQARLSYVATQLGRFTLIPEFRVTNYDTDDFKSGTVTISQAYRNRVALQPGLTARYQLAPQRDLLMVVQFTHLAYRTGAEGLPKRDSDGVAVLGGLDYPAPGANVRLRALVGVQTRQYSSAAYRDQVAPIVEASAIWTPTRLTTLTLSARRDIEDAADDSIGSYVATALRLSVDHELRRNVLLRGFAEVRRADFDSAQVAAPTLTVPAAGTTRTLYSVGAGATWRLNRNVRLGLDLAVNARQSSNEAGNYTATTGLLTLGFRL